MINWLLLLYIHNVFRRQLDLSSERILTQWRNGADYFVYFWGPRFSQVIQGKNPRSYLWNLSALRNLNFSVLFPYEYKSSIRFVHNSQHLSCCYWVPDTSKMRKIISTAGLRVQTSSNVALLIPLLPLAYLPLKCWPIMISLH